MQYRPAFTTSLFPLLVAGLLAAMTYWLEMATRQQGGPTDGKSRHDPDYMVENFEVRRFGPDGALQHTLRATFMQHYPDDDTTHVTAPDLTYHRTPPTHVTAKSARLDSEGKHVELIDDVRVTRGGLNGRPDTVLTTTRLDAFPDDERATTREPVTITQGLSIVHGIGLDANAKSAIHVLDGPVRGIFHRARGPAAMPASTPPSAAPAVKPEAKPVAKPVQPAARKPLQTQKPKAKSKAKPKTKASSQPKAKR